MYTKNKACALIVSVLIFTASLSGCAAMQVAISHRNLDVQTKMSDSIFLNPVDNSMHTAYVQLKETADKDLNLSSIKQQIVDNLSKKGYKIVSPSKAHYWIQANILQIGKTDPAAAEKMLANGYGGALAGAAIGGVTSESYGGVVAGGIIGGITETVANSMVKNVTFTMITDLQISERSAETVTQTTTSNLHNGSSTQTHQKTNKTTNWVRYRTRVLSTANKVNLHFKDALPQLQAGLVKSVSGIL